MNPNAIVLTLLALVAPGCTAFVPAAVHTIDVAPGRQADVVWMLDQDYSMFRCSDSVNGPVCVKAKTTDQAPPPPAAASPAVPPAPSTPPPVEPETAEPAPATETGL